MRNGSSSILVIFVLLCITTFATLSLVSAMASYRLAQQVAASSSAFYEADSRAVEIMAEAIQAGEEGIISYTVPISDVLHLHVSADLSGGDVQVIEWRTRVEYEPEIYDTLALPVFLFEDFDFDLD